MRSLATRSTTGSPMKMRTMIATVSMCAACYTSSKQTGPAAAFALGATADQESRTPRPHWSGTLPTYGAAKAAHYDRGKAAHYDRGKGAHYDRVKPRITTVVKPRYEWTPGASWPVRVTYSTYDPG
jgi:hypothetical protein